MSNLSPQQPIFFLPNRVWRCYTGGALLDQFVGNASPTDGHTPEDWLSSTVRAMNGPNSQGETEGLSRVRLADGAPGPLLLELLTADPAGYLGPAGNADDLGVLCKFLDSSVRLPIQCHPDKAFAREFLHSDHGKAESWVILATREIDGKAPYLLMGFKPGIREEAFVAAVKAQDVAAMEAMLHRIPARPGDTFFIPGRFPHAIGPGVFMLEVQEPSDWVVQPEAVCAGTALSRSDMWGPLDPDLALRCFAYAGETEDEVRRRCLQQPETIRCGAGGHLERIVGPATTDCFGIERLTIETTFTAEKTVPYHIEVVAAGSGTLTTGDASMSIRQGQVYFIPYGVGAVDYAATDAPLVIYRCLPGMAVR